jgi:hypothetical protein
MKKLINYDNNNLYCIYSKEKIEIGEEYAIVIDNYLGEEIKKTYKLEYIDCLDDE